MAHEISFVNGTAEAFFALKPAWHGLGAVLDNVPTSEQAIEAAHLDWRVQLKQLKTEDGLEVPGHFATVRSDNSRVLGVVSDSYKTVQNSQAFSFLDSLVESGDMLYESAGALRGGKIVWILGRMPSIDMIAEGDVSYRYVLFSTSHDGTAAIHAIPTSTRVVCANTLRIAVSNDKGIRHTGDVRQKLDRARLLLSQFDQGFTLFRDQAQLLAQRRFSDKQARAYISELFPEVDASQSRARTIREKKLFQVRRNFVNSRQTIPSIKGTWWALLNSVTELVDHPDPTTSTRNRADLAETKMISVLDGAGAEFKQRALNLAIDLSA